MIKDNETALIDIHLNRARRDNVEIVSILISVGDRVKKGDIVATYSYSDRGLFGRVTEERVKISSPSFGVVASIHISLGDRVNNNDLLVKLIKPIQRYCIVVETGLSELTENVNYKMDEFWIPQGPPFKGMESRFVSEKQIQAQGTSVNTDYVNTDIWCQAMVYTKE